VKKLTQKLASFFKIIFLGLTMASSANAATAEENKTAGITFLTENGKKANIVTTASGLQYEVLTKGTGTKSPAATDSVEVNYEGKLLDGKVFDSSYQRGESISFPLNGVIKGWTEGLQLMTEGAKYRLYIPSDLAYGEVGRRPVIPANAALIFDVELLKIK
jgi:FKBP-type peptidyl-prolyl cis-trans isomerase